MPISILVHGGAGDSAHPDDSPEDAMRGCLAAARAGYEVLRRGGSSLDAVVAAAVVMEGERFGAGAVANIRGIKNPIRLARLVMERTPHVLLACEGAIRFAKENG